MNYRAMIQPYQGKRISMMLILPKSGVNIDKIEKDISAEKLRQTYMKMNWEELDFSLPKFKIKWGTKSLKKSIIGLGVKSLFDPHRNSLPGLLEPPDSARSEDVYHQAVLEADESGSIASAATAVTVAAATSAAASSPPIEFKVDRPFLFLILENSTNAVLFIGRLSRPGDL